MHVATYMYRLRIINQKNLQSVTATYICNFIGTCVCLVVRWAFNGVRCITATMKFYQIHACIYNPYIHTS